MRMLKAAASGSSRGTARVAPDGAPPARPYARRPGGWYGTRPKIERGTAAGGHEAATRIQCAWRGHKTREDLYWEQASRW